MPPRRTILFDVGDTLVRAAPPATPTDVLTAEPLPGVVELLASLAPDHRLGAVTDTAVMTAADVRALLAPVGLSAPLEVVVTSAELGVAKPAPDGITAALVHLGSTAADAVFVGDSTVDRDAARAAGTCFLGVGARFGGATTAERLARWQHDGFCDDPIHDHVDPAAPPS